MTTSRAVIEVSVVEDDVRVRSSLAHLIDASEGFRCASQHPSGENALEELPLVNPAVVLMDINMPGLSGVQCVSRLKQLLPKVQVVMLTVYENTDHIFSALAAGASGYLLKQTPPEQLLEAIRDVHAGGSPMSSHIARKVVASFHRQPQPASDQEKLSTREQEVLDYLVKGYMYKEIAEAMKISFDTVHSHVRKIYEKLHVRTRTEAVTKHLRQAGLGSAAVEVQR
jgi:DNA-binding NarL/FixJ family response regulator